LHHLDSVLNSEVVKNRNIVQEEKNKANCSTVTMIPWQKNWEFSKDILQIIKIILLLDLKINDNWMHQEYLMDKRENSENILLRNNIKKMFYFMKSPCKKIIATMNDMNPTQDLMNCVTQR
jgi:hypothetical protein